MLTILILLQNLRWMLPTTFMIGAAPVYISVWEAWRLLTLPLPRWLYVLGDDFLFSTYHRNVLFCFEALTGTEMIFYGDLNAIKELAQGENVLYLSNHQSTVDWVIASSVAFRRGCLGRIRYVLKDGLRFLPMYGFYLAMHGSLFVKRSGKFQKDKAAKKLSLDKKDNIPMWWVVFTEGTRYNPDLPDVIEASQKFAQDQGEPQLQHMLYPRLGATQVCLETLASRLDCVYDVTIAYSSTVGGSRRHRGPAPSMQDFLMGMCKQVHIHVQRIPLCDVPTDSLRHWMYVQHQRKDSLLTQFYSASPPETAKFPGASVSRRLPLTSVLPSVLLWSGTFAVVISLKETRDLYWKVGLGSAVASVLWMSFKH